MKFKDFKTEIVTRAKKSSACSSQVQRAENAENFKELFEVIVDNFDYSCRNGVIDCELLTMVGNEECNKHSLFINESSNVGYIIADSATVDASGSATVDASGSATVRAWGSATVRAWDSATVRASDSATVRASGSAYINSMNSIDHKISEKVILRYYYQNRVILADGIESKSVAP